MVNFNNFFSNKKNLYILVGVIIIAIIVVGCIIFDQCNHGGDESFEIENAFTSGQVEKQNNDGEAQNIVVHIIGEVNSPGIVEVHEGGRIKDVIEKSGGLTEQADISKINLAYVVQDGQKIVIPNQNEKSTDTMMIDENKSFIAQDTAFGGGKININTATQTELESLTGVGPSMAAKIVSYRKEHGKFSKIEDLKKVPGIGNSKFDVIKTEICVK